MAQPATSNQATDLMGYLTEQREHMLGILGNLPEEAMRRPVLPTGWTCAGLVQHLSGRLAGPGQPRAARSSARTFSPHMTRPVSVKP